FDRSATCAIPHNDLFKLDLRTEALEVLMNHGHCELLTFKPICYGAFPTLERPGDFGFVPALGVSDVAEAEVVLLGPEEWDVIEGFAPAEDVVRRCLALALGDDPVFDANLLTGQPVGPARDVAGSEDAWDAALEVLIDDDAAIDSEP